MRAPAALVLLSALLLCSWCAGQYPRLRRPERLASAEQLTNYLKELQEYYSVHGRGRYGKRQMHIADASVTYRESPAIDDNVKQDVWKSLGYK